MHEQKQSTPAFLYLNAAQSNLLNASWQDDRVSQAVVRCENGSELTFTQVNEWLNSVSEEFEREAVASGFVGRVAPQHTLRRPDGRFRPRKDG